MISVRSWRARRWSARRWCSSAGHWRPRILKRAPCIRPIINEGSVTPMPSDTPEISVARALASLRGRSPAFSPGEVWLVGAGPGDPGLLTLDALMGLVQADVIVHDALVDARVLALARSGAQMQFAGKRGGKPSIAQEDISAQLI